MKRYLLTLLIILLIGITYFTVFFFKKERSFSENLRLEQENQDLRAQIQRILDCKLPDGECGTISSTGKYLSVKVFSTYPFNIKNQLTLNAGEKQGVKTQATAIVGLNILVGQVSGVFENVSVVRTIFDPNLELPVRIGKDEISGMLQGGALPKVILIEKPIQVGDIVYSASAEFPYGLKVGEITEIKESAAGVFREAAIKIPFVVGELRELTIIK